MVGSLAYGVLISEEDYQRLRKELFEERQAILNGEPMFCETMGGSKVPFIAEYEKDEKTAVCIDNPYETEDYLAVIRGSQKSACNGVEQIKIRKGKNWDKQIQDFLEKHGIIPQSKPSWLLIGCYN